MPVRNKLAYYLKIVAGFFLLLLAGRWMWIVFTRNTREYVAYFLYSSGRDTHWAYKGETYIVILFLLLKIFLFSAGVFLLYRLYVVLKHNKPLIHQSEDYFFYGAADSILANTAYIKQQPAWAKGLLALIIIILVPLQVYLLFCMPFHYDEGFSYMHFSGRGLLADITFYPVPNNHIFYNIVSTVFLFIPVNPVTAIRLPNILISVFSVYYFYKPASALLSRAGALIATTIFTFSFPFIMYSVQARGYAFVMFFSVAILYCFIKIVEKENVKKYTGIYILCAVLGLYTMPTFGYILLPVSLVFFMYSLTSGSTLNHWLSTHVKIIVFSCLLYASLFMANGIDVFQKAIAAGVEPVQDSFTYQHVIKHLQDTWGYITTGIRVPAYMLLIPLSTLAFLALKQHKGKRYVMVLLLLLLLSPLPLLLLQRSIPFPRTWTYLMIPFSIGIAAVPDLIFNGFKRTGILVWGMVALFILLYAPLLSQKAWGMYKWLYNVDYVVKTYTGLLKGKLSKVNTIPHTGDFSFYLAEDLQFVAMQKGHLIKTQITDRTDSLAMGDIVVTIPGKEIHLPDNYTLVPVDNSYFRLYIRKDL